MIKFDVQNIENTWLKITFNELEIWVDHQNNLGDVLVDDFLCDYDDLSKSQKDIVDAAIKAAPDIFKEDELDEYHYMQHIRQESNQDNYI